MVRAASYLVTGATGGLGALVCEHLVATGARVIATCRSGEQLEALADKPIGTKDIADHVAATVTTFLRAHATAA